MNKLSHKQASSSGLCSVTSPMRRFSSPRFLETYRVDTDEAVEDTTIVEEDIPYTEEEETAISCSLSDDAAADENIMDTIHNQPRMFRQEAVSQCTAEIHVNPLTDE